MMCCERFGGRTSWDCLQNRRLHFQKSAVLEEAPRLPDNCDAFFEYRAGMLIRNKIQITLPVPGFDVL